jgi:hypothetical protein
MGNEDVQDGYNPNNQSSPDEGDFPERIVHRQTLTSALGITLSDVPMLAWKKANFNRD